MGTSIAALIPDANKPRATILMKKIRVREIKALHVNDPDQHAFTIVVQIRISNFPQSTPWAPRHSSQ